MKPKPKPLTQEEYRQRRERSFKTGRKWISPTLETKKDLEEAVALGQWIGVYGPGYYPLLGHIQGMYLVESNFPTPWCAGVEVVDRRVVKVLPWRCAWLCMWRNEIRYRVVTTMCSSTENLTRALTETLTTPA